MIKLDCRTGETWILFSKNWYPLNVAKNWRIKDVHSFLAYVNFEMGTLEQFKEDMINQPTLMKRTHEVLIENGAKVDNFERFESLMKKDLFK